MNDFQDLQDELPGCNEHVPFITPQMIHATGVDLQGIHWPINNNTRDQFRQVRLSTYQNFRNTDKILLDTNDKIEQIIANSNMFRFTYTTLAEKSDIIHFQLRHLCASTSKNSIFYSHKSTSVHHWNPVSKESTRAIDLLSDGFGTVRICALDAMDNVVMVGGFNGEYVCSVQGRHENTLLSGNITRDSNGITNHLNLMHNRSGVSSNDEHIRILNMALMKIKSDFKMPWPVNCTSASPDGRLIIAGDCVDGIIADLDTGKEIGRLKGHLDFSFSCAWSPDGITIATGNQDLTARLYDTRNTSRSFKTIKSKMSTVRNLKFSSRGMLAMAEAADFVHLIDGSRTQTIDFFGDVAGLCFDPSGDTLWIANADDTYGGLIEHISSDFFEV